MYVVHTGCDADIALVPVNSQGSIVHPMYVIARKLARYDIDVAALSETRRSGEGQLREGGGYTFYWKGKAPGERRIHSVGFAIKNKIVNRLSEHPFGNCERLIILLTALQ